MRHLLIFTTCLFIILQINTGCVKDSFIELNQDTMVVAKIYQSEVGKDAVIESLFPDSSFLDNNHLATFSWTNSGLFNVSRALIYFDLSEIPVSYNIKNAKLSLFWTNNNNLTGQTGDNSFSISKITEPWSKDTLTWNNQPQTSNINQVNVEKSKISEQSYFNIDITEMVQSMISSPETNHGFMLKLITEEPYRLVILASHQHPDIEKHPKLTINY